MTAWIDSPEPYDQFFTNVDVNAEAARPGDDPHIDVEVNCPA